MNLFNSTGIAISGAVVASPLLVALLNRFWPGRKGHVDETVQLSAAWKDLTDNLENRVTAQDRQLKLQDAEITRLTAESKTFREINHAIRNDLAKLKGFTNVVLKREQIFRNDSSACRAILHGIGHEAPPLPQPPELPEFAID